MCFEYNGAVMADKVAVLQRGRMSHLQRLNTLSSNPLIAVKDEMSRNSWQSQMNDEEKLAYT